MSDAAPGVATLTDEFVEVVCADPLLLRAEFDALVAASWDCVPRPPPRSTRTLVGVVDPGGDPRRIPLAIRAVGRPRPPRIDAEVHQRSPPAA